MATRKQKQELIDTLKFTPIRARVYIQGYGGECYIGRVSREEYEVYKKGRVDLDQYANDWDDDDKWSDIPEKLRIFSPGQPYDCDNLCHASGATMDDSSCIVIEDEHGNTIWESSLDASHLVNQGVDVGAGGDVWESADEPDGTIVFWGGQGEKGVFFDGEFLLKAPFDPNKLHISYSEADGWQLSSGVQYDDEDIEGYDGYSTTGKWSEYKFHIIGDEEVYQGVERNSDEEGEEEEEEEASENWDPAEELDKIDVPVIEGEEMWAQEAIDESTWNGIPYSSWQPGYLEPAHRGFYDVQYESGSWPWPIDDHIKWTGKKWLHKRDGDQTIMRWRGLSQPIK